MTKDEYCKATNAYITDYIKLADAKAGALFTAVGALTAALASAWDKILSAGSSACFKHTVLGIMLLTSVAIFAVVVCTFSALIPRSSDTQQSLNSFPHIAGLGHQEYTKRVTELDETTIFKEYASHNAVLATVAAKKFLWIARGTKFLGASVVGGLLLVVFYVCAKL